MLELLKDYCSFILYRKKYWLLPIVLLLILLGGIIVVGEGSAMLPFIYTFF
jgi:hypothetical protein